MDEAEVNERLLNFIHLSWAHLFALLDFHDVIIEGCVLQKQLSRQRKAFIWVVPMCGLKIHFISIKLKELNYGDTVDYTSKCVCCVTDDDDAQCSSVHRMKHVRIFCFVHWSERRLESENFFCLTSSHTKLLQRGTREFVWVRGTDRRSCTYSWQSCSQNKRLRI